MTASEWARFWYYILKLNVIPFDTRKRKSILSSYLEYQNVRVPQLVFEEWIRRGLFERGMAIIPGRIYLDNKNEEWYWVSIDLDSDQAIMEFCGLFGKDVTINDLSQRFLIEQHDGNLKRAHVSMISPIPFPNKGTDKVLGLEIKSRGEDGIMFVAPSPHKDGSNYRIIGTQSPPRLTLDEAIDMIGKIKLICSRYGLKYSKKKSQGLTDKRIKSMITNLEIEKGSGYTISEGQRNDTLFSISRSILYHHYKNNNNSKQKIEKLKQFFDEINIELCYPNALPQSEVDSIWRSSLRYNEGDKQHPEGNKVNSDDDSPLSQDLIEVATERILAEHKFITIEETKQILCYNNGVYGPGGEVIVEKEIEKHFGYLASNKDIAEIKGHIMRKTFSTKSAFDRDLNIINLQNGLYDITRNVLMPHSPSYLSKKQHPIFHNPFLKPKLFGKFLKEVLYATEIKTAVEVMAYTFYRDYPFECFVTLVGDGANGKSVFTGLLTRLLGEENVSNVSLSSLVDNRFALADLESKCSNIDTELSPSALKDTSVLKKLTGGSKQPIRIEQKYQKAYDTILYAKLFFNANKVANTPDTSNAFYRRQIIISFPNKFEGKDDDPDLLVKLSTQEEMSVVFNVLMIALRRILKKKGIYLNEKTIEEKRSKYDRTVNPVQAFMDEVVIKGPNEIEHVIKSHMYDAYKQFCKNLRLPLISSMSFGKELKKMKLEEGREGSGERRTFWMGTRLKTEYLFDIQN